MATNYFYVTVFLESLDLLENSFPAEEIFPFMGRKQINVSTFECHKSKHFLRRSQLHQHPAQECVRERCSDIVGNKYSILKFV